MLARTGEIRTLVDHLWEGKNGTADMETVRREVPQKTKNKIIIKDTNSTSEYIPQKIESGALKRYLYTRVDSSITHNS